MQLCRLGFVSLLVCMPVNDDLFGRMQVRRTSFGKVKCKCRSREVITPSVFYNILLCLS